MSEPFTCEEALESARAHATKAARFRSAAEETGSDGLLRLAEEHVRTGLTLRAYAILAAQVAAAEKRAEEAERENRSLQETWAHIKQHNEGRCDNTCALCFQFASLTSQLAAAKEEVERLKGGVWKEHKPTTNEMHDPANGLIAGLCRRCAMSWPCVYSPEAALAAAPSPEVCHCGTPGTHPLTMRCGAPSPAAKEHK